MHRLCGEGEGSGEDSLARHHLRLEDHHRVALEGCFGHGLGRRRLDDLRLGPAHPMTREITDLLRTALNEQLDWRLDDFDLRMLGPEFREFGLEI